MPTFVLQNETPQRLSIKGANDHVLILSPLERARVIDEDKKKLFALDDLADRNLISYRPEKTIDLVDRLAGIITLFGVGYFIAGGVLADQWKTTWPSYWLIAGIVLAVALILIGWAVSRGSEVVMQSGAQAMSFLLISAVAIGIPAAVIYFWGGDAVLFESDPTLLTLGRWLQFLFIATASILPGLLYYLFDRQQLATLRERFEQQIFRFDPNVTTLRDVRARYGKQMEEVYGREDVAAAGRRLNRTKRWPILVATLVITLGWIVALTPVDEGAATPVVDTGAELIDLFIPEMNPVILGFLGAYFFALFTVLRRYVRRDLKPSAYASITVRIFAVVILAWLLTLINVDPSVVGVLAFLVGIVPDTGLALIQETLRTRSSFGKLLPTYTEEHPLTKLEGIDLYDRARLEDEGVTNVQSLAHHDLIDLMVETRIPVPRLVDWVDQAILYLHVTRMEKATAFDWHSRLGAAGIRNATDLIIVLEDADKPDARFAIDHVLGLDEDPTKVEQLIALLSSVKDDEWLIHIRHWRKPEFVEHVEISAIPRMEPEVQPTEIQPLPEGALVGG